MCITQQHVCFSVGSRFLHTDAQMMQFSSSIRLVSFQRFFKCLKMQLFRKSCQDTIICNGVFFLDPLKVLLQRQLWLNEWLIFNQKLSWNFICCFWDTTTSNWIHIYNTDLLSSKRTTTGFRFPSSETIPLTDRLQHIHMHTHAEWKKHGNRRFSISVSETDQFQNHFTSRMSRQFATKLIENIPTTPKSITTLPSKLLIFKNYTEQSKATTN